MEELQAELGLVCSRCWYIVVDWMAVVKSTRNNKRIIVCCESITSAFCVVQRLMHKLEFVLASVKHEQKQYHSTHSQDATEDNSQTPLCSVKSQTMFSCVH